MARMKIICMCCDKHLGYKDDQGSGCKKTSGLCDKCLKNRYPAYADEVIRMREEEQQAA